MKTRLFTIFLTLSLAALLGLETPTRAQGIELGDGVAVTAEVVGIDRSATVQAIDKQKRDVTMELPNGKTVTTKADPAVNAFDTLKVGDSIHAHYTEAVAISVEAP